MGNLGLGKGFGRKSSEKETHNDEDQQMQHVARKLGVHNDLQRASNDVKRDFQKGVDNAVNTIKFKNLDPEHPDVMKFVESSVKKRLAEPITDERPWVMAKEDEATALSPKTFKRYNSPSLGSYMRLRAKQHTGLQPVFHGGDLESGSNGYQAYSGYLLNENLNSTDNAEFRYINRSDPDVTEEALTLSERVAKNYYENVYPKQYEKEKEEQNIENIRSLIVEEINMQDTLARNDIQMKNIDNELLYESINIVKENKDLIYQVAEKYHIEPEFLAGIVFRENYIRSISDNSANTLTDFGDDNHKIFIGSSQSLEFSMSEVIPKLFGEHSTGICAVTPSSARVAMNTYQKETGVDYSEYTEMSDYELQIKMAEDNEFSLELAVLVLADKAKDNGLIKSTDELGTLNEENTIKVLHHYNGRGAYYGYYVYYYAPYLRDILENTNLND